MKSIDVELRKVTYMKTPYYFIKKMLPIGFDKKVENPKDGKVYKLVREMINKKQVIQCVNNAYFQAVELEVMYNGVVHRITNFEFPKELQDKRLYCDREVIAEHNGKEGWIRIPAKFDNCVELDCYDVSKTSTYRVITNTAIACEDYDARVVCESKIPSVDDNYNKLIDDGKIMKTEDIPFTEKVAKKYLSQNNDILVAIQDEFSDADLLLDTLMEKGYGIVEASNEVNRIIGLLNWDITEKTFISAILKVLNRPDDSVILSQIPSSVRENLHPNDTLACDEFVGVMENIDW